VVPFSIDGRRTLLVGFGPRTSREALTFLHDALVPEFADDIVGVELASWRMNLDGGLLPVADDVVISDRRSIVSAVVLDGSGSRACDLFAVFADLGIHVIDTTREESVYSQSCNCVCLGERTIICYDLCPRVREQLEERGIDVLTVPGSELVKGRGGPRCMTRPIYLDLRRTKQREEEDHAKLEWLRSAVRNGVDDLDQGNYTTLRSRREIEVFIDQIQAETKGTGR
jgi:N-dimethylarginine dimethylaminohydrolase